MTRAVSASGSPPTTSMLPPATVVDARLDDDDPGAVEVAARVPGAGGVRLRPPDAAEGAVAHDGRRPQAFERVGVVARPLVEWRAERVAVGLHAGAAHVDLWRRQIRAVGVHLERTGTVAALAHARILDASRVAARGVDVDVAAVEGGPAARAG